MGNPRAHSFDRHQTAVQHITTALRTLVTDMAEIADLIGVTEKTAQEYCRDARRDEKKAQQDQAWELWLDCVSQVDIAERLGVPQPTVSRWVSIREQSSEVNSPPASRQHFDVWQFPTADQDAGQQSYFGAVPPQVVENLLWFYTEPGDVVVGDRPAVADSGTTVDVRCAGPAATGRWDMPRSPVMPAASFARLGPGTGCTGRSAAAPAW